MLVDMSFLSLLRPEKFDMRFRFKHDTLNRRDFKYESSCEKTGFLHICENKDADQRLCFRYKDSTIPLLPKSEISSLK